MLGRIASRSRPKNDPLFYFQSVALLNFAIHLKRAILAAGIDLSNYCAHSFRISATTTVARKGLQDSTIKQLGRWQSAEYQRYAKPSAKFLTHIASLVSQEAAGWTLASSIGEHSIRNPQPDHSS